MAGAQVNLIGCPGHSTRSIFHFCAGGCDGAKGMNVLMTAAGEERNLWSKATVQVLPGVGVCCVCVCVCVCVLCVCAMCGVCVVCVWCVWCVCGVCVCFVCCVCVCGGSQLQGHIQRYCNQHGGHVISHVTTVSSLSALYSNHPKVWLFCKAACHAVNVCRLQ